MTALAMQALVWIHDQVEQAVTGAATPLRPPPAISADDDYDAPDVVYAEWTE